MFGVGEEVETQCIDPRVLAFGDAFAVITQPKLFLDKITKAANDIGHKTFYQRVRYVDESEHDGAVGPDVKTANYSYQSEFRVSMHPGLGCATLLRIGNIRDIAFSGRSEYLPRLIRLTHPSF
jgi:hypothetical protein